VRGEAGRIAGDTCAENPTPFETPIPLGLIRSAFSVQFAGRRLPRSGSRPRGSAAGDLADRGMRVAPGLADGK
jgi:hypothetical protein